MFYADGSGHTSDGSGHLSDLGFSDAAVPLARLLADTVLSVSWFAWDSEFLAPAVPPDTLRLLALLGSLSFVALSLSLFILFILFILGFNARVQPEQPAPKYIRLDRRLILWSSEQCQTLRELRSSRQK